MLHCGIFESMVAGVKQGESCCPRYLDNMLMMLISILSTYAVKRWGKINICNLTVIWKLTSYYVHQVK